MKNGKRILSVTIKHVMDENPDTSYLGEYSNRAKSDYAIDRKHSLDCPVNAGKDGLMWYTSSSGRIELQMTWEQAESASHSGQCDNDVLVLTRVPEIAKQLASIDPAALSSELKEYGAWDESERADHEGNLQRLVWLAAGDITDSNGCDCGERGDMASRELRYFNPPVENYKGESDTDIHKYCLQDYKRMELLDSGNWYFLGIVANAKISCTFDGHEYTDELNASCWGFESDMSAADFAEEESNQLAELKAQLSEYGFSRRAITAAFKNVEKVSE